MLSDADKLLTKRLLLATALEVSVALMIPDVARLSVASRLRLARNAGKTLASYGDILQFKSKPRKARRRKNQQPVVDPPPETADVFNALARGLAAAHTLGTDVAYVLRCIQHGFGELVEHD